MLWDRLKQRFAYSYLHPRYLAQRELRHCVMQEAALLRGTLLDVGCGKKPYADLIQVDTYIGLDVPTSMHGIQKVDVIGTAWRLPFRDQVFDSILCTEVLEHVPDPVAALQEMRRVTRTHGVLLLTVPLSEQLHEEPYDFYRFTRYALTDLLDKTGWRVKRIHERGGVWLELGYRLSSALYTELGARRASGGALQPRLILGPLIVVACTLIQLIASRLDHLWRSSLSTIGYCVVAEKI